jgi:arginine repressor
MDKETFEVMKVEKKERQRMILVAIEQFKIYTQPELVEKLKLHYKIKTNQSTVSRDIEYLEIERDEDKNYYIPGTKARRNKEANKLAKLLLQANVKSKEEDMEQLFIKGNADYMPLIASQIESLLAVDGITIHSFVGQNGSLALYYPTENKIDVEKILTKIFGHLAKFRANGAK